MTSWYDVLSAKTLYIDAPHIEIYIQPSLSILKAKISSVYQKMKT